MRSLRAIYNKAVARGVIETPLQCPFAEVFTGVEVTRKRALTPVEMTRISRFRLPAGQLERARRYFLFAFLAQGMSFVDMAYLKKEDVQKDVIYYRRKKTGQSIMVSITPELRELINSFCHETARSSPYLLPIIRYPGENERLQYESALRLQNKWLKRLQAEAQLRMENGELRVKENNKNKRESKSENQKSKTSKTINSQLQAVHYPLSSHVARHTWATLAKHQNMPIGLISECLGHTSEKTTRIYLRGFERHVLIAANQKIARLIY